MPQASARVDAMKEAYRAMVPNAEYLACSTISAFPARFVSTVQVRMLAWQYGQNVAAIERGKVVKINRLRRSFVNSETVTFKKKSMQGNNLTLLRYILH
jgi:hypothetical protein